MSDAKNNTTSPPSSREAAPMADVELLPLPIPHCTYADHSYPAFKPQQMKAYARACVAHATAAKDAEVEALQEQLEWTVKQNDMLLDEGRKLTAHAERLAEALRIAEAALADISDGDVFGDDFSWCKRRAALGLRVVRDTLHNSAFHPADAQENGDA